MASAGHGWDENNILTIFWNKVGLETDDTYETPCMYQIFIKQNGFKSIRADSFWHSPACELQSKIVIKYMSEIIFYETFPLVYQLQLYINNFIYF